MKISSSTAASAVLICLGIVFVAQCVLSMSSKSSTYDETSHLTAAHLIVTYAEYGWSPEHPPLSRFFAGLPLQLFTDSGSLTSLLPINTWHEAQRFLYQINDADRLLFLGRLGMLPIALLLGFAIFLWARDMFGTQSALVATLLYTFSPNMVAHARLVTTDITATCFIFLAMYCFYRVVSRITLGRVITLGVCLGLAFVSKFSTLLLIPIILLLGGAVIVLDHPLHLQVLPTHVPRKATRKQDKLLVIGLSLVTAAIIAYIVIWAAYRFRYEGIITPGQHYRFSWQLVLPEQPVLKALVLWAKQFHVLPEPFLLGVCQIMKRTQRLSFLLGEISHGTWYYFIVTFLLKTPIAFIISVVVSLLVFPKALRTQKLKVAFLLLPAAVYFFIASASKMNIGHRHILPIYPFLFVFASAVVVWLSSRATTYKIIGIGLSLWYVIAALSIYPHYLAYFNESIGGPEYGYRYLVDSNLDWGQDLKGLKQYMDEHEIDHIWLSYFGTASPAYYGISYNYLPSDLILDPPRMTKPTPYVAISATTLQGLYVGSQAPLLEPFRFMTPIGKIGYSIFVYHATFADVDGAQSR